MRCLYDKLRRLGPMGDWRPPASHAETCPDCQAFIRASRDVEEALGQTQPDAASPELHQRIMNSVRLAAAQTNAVPEKNGFPPAFRFRLAMAGTVVAVLLVAMMVYTLRPPAPMETAAPPPVVEGTLPDLNALVMDAIQPESFFLPIEEELEFLRADLRRATDFGLGHLLHFAALAPEED